MRIESLLIICLLILFNSCRNDERLPRQSGTTTGTPDDPVINANQTLSRTEDADIESYVKRRGLQMQMTESGLRYSIYHQGYGIAPEEGDKVDISYTLSLINGQVVYSSKADGNKKFVLGKDEEVRGLDEAMRLLKVGDKAILIIPSVLGYGLVGDGDMIPRHATLIYDVEFESITKQP